MKPLRTPAVALGVGFIVCIGLLGPLLGSTADSSSAFADHFAENRNLVVDLIASVLLVVVAGLMVWSAIEVDQSTAAVPGTTKLRDVVTRSSNIAAAGLVVSAGLLATVPLTTLIGKATDDPGIDVTVQAGIAQAGTVVLIVTMLVAGAMSVTIAHLGRRAGAIPTWILVSGWVVAVLLILGISIALLFPYGAWNIALGLTWRDHAAEPGT